MRKLHYHDKFIEDLRTLDKSEQERVIHSLEKIRLNPELGKPLRPPLAGFFSERVGRLRIIYEYDSENIHLRRCRERKKAY